MNEDSIELMRQCTSGCIMAMESMRQVREYANDSGLIQVLDDYESRHKELEKEFAELLSQAGEEEKKPNVMASAFSKLSAEMKLTLKNNSNEIAKLMVEGSNMGIQSVSEYRNKYANASEEAKKLAGKLVKLEESFIEEMINFL